MDSISISWAVDRSATLDTWPVKMLPRFDDAAGAISSSRGVACPEEDGDDADAAAKFRERVEGIEAGRPIRSGAGGGGIGEGMVD
jgi:hypothetical protein